MFKVDWKKYFEKYITVEKEQRQNVHMYCFRAATVT